ncbi:hypothetical protein EDD11_006239 [Mortierella claussenii]|nr:hypothetical protein EDD11_006239 [Mortierella claussenii]
MAGRHQQQQQQQQGQILYLGGSTGSQGGPGGSLSTRFQKLAQARGSGIIIVNQPTAVDNQHGGGGHRGLGLGHNTGSHPVGRSGHAISINKASRVRAGAAADGGIRTAGGLARAMQERGTGVTDEFLLAPGLVTGEGGSRGGGGGRSIRGGGGGGPRRGPGDNHHNSNSNNHNHNRGNDINTQAGRHRALVLGNRPGKKRGGGAGGSNSPNPQRLSNHHAQPPQGKGKNGRPSPASSPLSSSSSKHNNSSNSKAGGKNKKGEKKAPADAQSLDSELTAYMMKNTSTAASFLDHDLDSYMADRAEEGLL